MARRRVNTKFLIILTVAVIGVGLLGLVVHKLRRGDPAKYVKAANELVAQKNYDEAVKNFQQAVSIEGRQPAVWIAYGDALAQLAHKDEDNAGRAVRAWQQALEFDPQNKEALSRMLALSLSETEGRSPSIATSIERGRDFAARLAKADPSSLPALYAGPLFTIRAANHGMQVEPERYAEAVQQLATLSAKHPADVELTTHATAAKIAHAQRVLKERPEDARKMLDEAGAIMAASVKAAPQSAGMHHHASQVYSVLAASATTPEARTRHADAAKAAHAEAVKLAKPSDERYASILLTEAMQLRAGDRAAAEKVARDIVAAKPDDNDARRRVAQFLAEDPAKRQEAIALLERPMAPQPFAPQTRFAVTSRAELPILIALTNLRLEEFAATNDAARRKDLNAKVEDGLSKLVTRLNGGADHPLALNLRGKFQRHQGDNVKAIQTLSRATTLLQQQNLQSDPIYLETIELLARAYVDTQQTGPAKELLGQILAQRENHVPTRLLLAKLLYQERDLAGVRRHLDVLEKQLPDLPDVIKLRLGTLDRAKEQDKVDAAYARLPEKTRAERLDKASTAQMLGNAAEVERLLTLQLGETPADPEVSVVLARHLASREQRERANAIVADALKAHPDNKLLQFEQKRLANASPEELRQWQMESIEQLTDPTQKAIQLAQLASTEGKADEALRQLKEAERTSPDNMNVKRALFAQHVARRQWDEAGRYADLLAKGDPAGGLQYRVQLAAARAQVATDPAERQAEVDRAVRYGKELTEKLPEFGQSWIAYAQALQLAGKPEEAIARFTTALEKQPSDLDAMRGMIECSAALNRPAEVKRWIEAALRLNPGHPFFLEQQTNYELTFGDPTKAIPPREAALKSNPDDPASWGGAANAYLAASRFHARNQNEPAAKQMLAKAAETLKGAIAKFPDDRRFYAGYVEAAFQMQDPASAEATIKELAARDAWRDKPEPQLMMAEFLARTGKLDESEKLLRSLVEKHPTAVGIQLSLVTLLTQRNKIDDALAALQPNGNDPNVRGQLVQLQIATGKLEEAEKTIAAALAADPKSVRYQALSGYVAMGRGMWEEADKRLQAALKLDPRDPIALYYHGLVRLNQPAPNIEEAVQRLTAARDAQPDPATLVDVRFALAQALLRRSDIDGAARELEMALAAQPNNRRVRLTLIDAYMATANPRLIDAERTIREGRALAANDPALMRAETLLWLRRKDAPRAVASARAAVAAAPKDEGLQNMLLTVLLDARDFAGAIKEADQMIAADKNRWWAFMQRAVAKRQSNDKDGALADFEAALAAAAEQRNDGAAQEVVQRLSREIGADEALARILPRVDAEPRWRFIAAQLYLSKGDHERAAETIERLLALGDKLPQRERAQALAFAGGLYLGFEPRPQVQKAYDTYLKLLDLSPSDMGALNNVACLLADQWSPPRPAEAIKYSQRALEVMQSAGLRDPLIMDTHGWMLTLNNRPQDGIDILRQAVALKSFPEGHYHLGEAYMKTQAPEDAQKQFEAAAELIRQAEEQKKDVDPALRVKVNEALAKAKELTRSKSANAAP